MALDFRTKNALLLAKIEAVIGTEENPVPAADAIRIRDAIGYSPNFANFEEGYVQESISQAAPIVSGGGVSFRLPVWLTGTDTANDAAGLVHPLARVRVQRNENGGGGRRHGGGGCSRHDHSR